MLPEPKVPSPAPDAVDVDPPKPQWSAPVAEFHGIEVTRNNLPGPGTDGVQSVCAS